MSIFKRLGFAVYGVCLLLVGCPEQDSIIMNPAGEGFYQMPWPNDIRLNPDGTLNLTSFPIKYLSPVGNQMVSTGARVTHGFGTNSGIMFTVTGDLDESSLPSTLESTQDTSPVQLVNISPESPRYLERVPVEIQFDNLQTLYQPGRLLTVLPYPGYSLAPNSRYALMVFNGVRNYKGVPLIPSTFLQSLIRHDVAVESIYPRLRAQFEQVERYLSANSQWTSAQLVGFTVFTTQKVTDTTLAVGKAVQAISDEEILSHVNGIYVYGSCKNGALSLYGNLDLPRWQKGVSPYLLAGGGINLDADGEAQIDHWDSNLGFYAEIGCYEARPTGKTVFVHAEGTGGDYYSAANAAYQFGSKFSDIVISVSPLFSGDRKDKKFAEQLAALQKLLNLNFDVGLVAEVAYYNYLNPEAARGNQIQAAADHVYVKRLGQLLPQILAKFEIDPQVTVGWTEPKIRQHYAGIIGQSQGATNAPMALAMDSDFKVAYLNGAGSNASAQALHRGSVRQLIDLFAPGIMQNELDKFHPLMQILQTFHEEDDGTNYAELTNTRYLLISAGYHDECVVREASGPLGFAYARFGKLQLAEIGFDWEDFTGITQVLQQPQVPLPLQASNLENAGVGLFYQLPVSHFAEGFDEVAANFLHSATAEDGQIFLPQTSDFGYYYECDYRVD